MRGRKALLSRLAREADARAERRGAAARLWCEHAVRRDWRAHLDALRDADVDAVVTALFALLSDTGPLNALVADLLAGVAADHFFDPPSPVIDDGIHHGLVLLDHPVAVLSLCVVSADAIAARKATGGGEGSIGVSGAVSIVRLHRAGRAVLDFWETREAACAPMPHPHFCRDGEVLVIDGRRRGYVIRSCRSDMVMLRATVRTGRLALRQEYDAVSGRRIGVASNDEAASRAQMLLTLLRLQGRRDAAHCFVDAIETGPHFLRWHAMRELLALDPATALPHLQRLAADDPHDEVRAAARATMAAIARPGAMPGGG